MQTFLPYKSFYKSLLCLDMKRLNSQCKEAKQIINIIENNQNAWSNHPAVNMWRGYVNALKIYYNLAVLIWNMKIKSDGTKVKQKDPIEIRGCITYPLWLGSRKFHNSHRSNLLRKNPEFYSQFKWNVPHNLPYFWPSKEGY